jgi:hypothetical protein
MAGGVSFAWRGATGMAHCSVYPDRAPIFGADGAGVSLTLAPAAPDVVTAVELSFARVLLAELRTYVAECERWVDRPTAEPEQEPPSAA